MTNADSYSWIGGTAGTWGTAANWEDLTTGTVAAAAPGIGNDVTIGAGVTVYGTASVATLAAINPEDQPPAPVTLAGDLNVGTLVSGGYFSVTGTLTGDDITIGQVAFGPGYFYSNSVLYGDGTIEAVPGGTITLFADSSGTNTFQLDGNATFLVLPNVFPGLGAGVSIVLNGTNNAIEISSTYDGLPNLFGTTLPTISTPIQGFNTTDQIDFEDTTFRVAAFSDGTLTLTGTGAPQTLYFAGDYTGDSFQVNGGVVTVVPDALLPHSYAWIGGAAGVWNNAANWEDLTAGTVAAVAPGIANGATIAGTVALSGTGSAANLTVLGDETIYGNINTGTLIMTGGASVSALDGATLDASGIILNPSIVSGITVDATSVIEIGTSHTGVAGALTVDSDNTLSGAATLAANVSGTGTIEVQADGPITIEGTVANPGLTFLVDGNASLVLDAPVAAGNTIDLLGNGNTIAIPVGQPAVGATIGGFNSSDVIYVSTETRGGNLYGDYTSAFYFNNTLTLTAYHPGLTPLVYSLSIPGNYASDAFHLTSNGLGQDVTLSPTATNTDSYSWIGGTAGTWGTPSNWQDLTTGALAGIAPGIDNDVTIGVGVTLDGTGSAARLTTSSAGSEGDTIAGALNVGTLAADNLLTLDSGTISGSDMTIGYVEPLPFGTPQLPVFGIRPGILGTGTIEVLAGGTLNLDGYAGGGTTFQLDGDATMVALGSIAGGNIMMDGSGNTLAITDVYNGATNYYVPGPPQIDATIQGFNTADVIVTDWIGDTPTAVAYANGTLTLSGPDGSQALTLAGDYSGDTFEVNAGTITVVPTPVPHSYSWIGGTAGTWGTTSNWEDLTTGTVAAAAPGIDNAVTIGGTATIFGTGTAASLEIQGAVSVAADLNVGTLTVDADAGLTIHIGNTIIAGTATLAGSLEGSEYPSNQGELVVSGTLQLDSDGGQITGYTQANSLVLNDASPQINGTIELGNAGVAASPYIDVGEVAIDQGHTLSGTGGLFEYLYNNPETFGAVYANGIVNGLVRSANLQIGEVVQSSYVIFEPRSPEYGFDFLGTSLSGTGTVEVLAGGTIYIAANVTGSGLTFTLDGSATLETAGTIATGNTIRMAGDTDTLLVNGGSMLASLATSFDGVGFTLNPDNRDTLPPTPPTTPFIGGTIYGFNPTDRIDVRGITFDAASWSGGTLDLLQGTNVVDTLTLSGDYADRSFVVSATSDAGQPREIVTLVACFAAGTRIDTRRGAIPVEHLRQGDMVLTASGGCQPIQWIGHRTLDLRRHPAPEQVQPIRIAPHAFGDNRPRQPLLLSPDHAVYADGVLIPIKYLANGTTVAQLDKAAVTYYHIELPRHDVVLAEGLPAESYLDTGDRSNFANGGGTLRLFPDFSTRSADASRIRDAYGYAPLIVTGPELTAVRQRLDERACQTTPNSPATDHTPRQPEAVAKAEPPRRSRRA